MKVIMRVPDEGYYEGTRWRLLWGYQMKVIMRVPDEGYYEGTRWRLLWGYQMKVIMRVQDEGYYEGTRWRLLWEYKMKVIMRVPDEGYHEGTRWRSFQKFVVRTNFDIYVFITHICKRLVSGRREAWAHKTSLHPSLCTCTSTICWLDIGTASAIPCYYMLNNCFKICTNH